MIEPTDSYAADARIIFFRLESLEEQMRAKDRELADRKKDAIDAEKDLNQAHQKIRSMGAIQQGSKIRIWILGGAVGTLSALCVELAVHFLEHQ